MKHLHGKKTAQKKTVHDDEKGDDLDDKNEDTNENELDDDKIQHATVVTGQQPITTGNIEKHHGEGRED